MRFGPPNINNRFTRDLSHKISTELQGVEEIIELAGIQTGVRATVISPRDESIYADRLPTYPNLTVAQHPEIHLTPSAAQQRVIEWLRSDPAFHASNSNAGPSYQRSIDSDGSSGYRHFNNTRLIPFAEAMRILKSTFGFETRRTGRHEWLLVNPTISVESNTNGIQWREDMIVQTTQGMERGKLTTTETFHPVEQYRPGVAPLGASSAQAIAVRLDRVKKEYQRTLGAERSIDGRFQAPTVEQMLHGQVAYNLAEKSLLKLIAEHARNPDSSLGRAIIAAASKDPMTPGGRAALAQAFSDRGWAVYPAGHFDFFPCEPVVVAKGVFENGKYLPTVHPMKSDMKGSWFQCLRAALYMPEVIVHLEKQGIIT